MKIVHIYKTDCFLASRVILQFNWVKAETVFLHRSAKQGLLELGSGQVESQRLTIFALIRLAFRLRGQGVRWVFHAQSSLLYLYVLMVIRCIDRKVAFALVYDIHDLNERPSVQPSLKSVRSWVRYVILATAEWGVAKMKSIRTVTVSNGLAKTFASRTGAQPPVVVRSAPLPDLTVDELASCSRFERALLFFGTPQRVPFELVESLAAAGHELHLYGRGINEELVRKSLPESLWGSVKLFGLYKPSSLSFIGQYRFVILYKPGIVSDNFRYSLPNKFFQGLAYGTSFVVSENFEEIREVAENVSGLALVVKSGEERRLVELLEESRDRSDVFYQDVHALAEGLSLGACEAYREVMGAIDVREH